MKRIRCGVFERTPNRDLITNEEEVIESSIKKRAFIDCCRRSYVVFAVMVMSHLKSFARALAAAHR